MKKILFLSLLTTVISIAEPLYTISVHGRPYIKGQEYTEAYARKKGINIKYKSLGCIIKPEKKIINEKNKKADLYYKKRFGDKWLENIIEESRKAMEKE